MKTVLGILLASLVVPAAAGAEVARSYDLESAPSEGLASNVAIDIISHGLAQDSVGVWLATGNGLNFTFDAGQTWYVHNTGTGLVSDNLSALFSVGGRLWVATNHHEMINGRLYLLSDGISFSDDNGLNWTWVDLDASGLDQPSLYGVDRYIYDIAGHVDTGFFNQSAGVQITQWLFFASKAGGLAASQDGGTSWRRIYASANDSAQFNSGGAPDLRNRFFSCAVDTSHGDTLLLWTGTAAGVFQYVFITPRDKFFSRWVNRIAFCDTCSDTTTANTMFVGGSQGVTVGPLTGGPFATRFEDVDGLPGQSVSALIDVGGRLLVGTVDTATGHSAGLAASTDMGDSYTPIALSEVQGADSVISDFALMGTRLYMGAQTAGLFVSVDTGANWSGILIDSTVVDSPINAVNALHVLADTLLAGTDDGLAKLYLNASGGIDSILHHSFAEEDSSAARVIRVKTQVFDDGLGGVDSTIIWTVHRPLTPAGDLMVGRYSDATEIWQALQVTALTHDVNFFGDTAFVVGGYGVRFTTAGDNPSVSYPVRQYDEYDRLVDGLDDDTVTCMEVIGDTILFGSSNGFAYSTDRGQTFTIVRPNLDSLGADFVINHTYFNSLNIDDFTYGITGDFVPALAVKYPDTGTAHVWVSGRPVGGGWPGRSVGKFNEPVIYAVIDTNGDTLVFDTVAWAIRWQAVDTLDFAWNFEFVGDSTFSATDAGLKLDIGDTTYASAIIPLVDDSTGEALVDAGTSVLAVEAADSLLWVGTDDGTVRLVLSGALSSRLFMTVDSSTAADVVYAYPVPFHPQRGQTVDFHFVVEKDGFVTIEIYDFAMNLVARPVDRVHYPSGTYPNGFSQGRTWDGRNGRGDIVAVGVYYFRVEYESGELRWGKLAVMP